MAQVILDISVSLDGFVAGPRPTLDEPLGEGGELLHEWAYPLKSFQERHGRSGGETNVDSELMDEGLRDRAATVMGRRMFSGGAGPWEDDPNARGWWGDDPPFRHPVFVVTHHAREPLVLGATTFTFVTAGVEAAIEQARAAAGDRDVVVAGGAAIAQQALRAGRLDGMQLHLVPLLLGDGVRLFERHVADAPRKLQCTRNVESPTGVAHLTYRSAP